jgi:HSP20 family molecular chaperone IbpA
VLRDLSWRIQLHAHASRDVDDANAKAEVRDGMVEVTLPKLEQAKKRDIKVQ